MSVARNLTRKLLGDHLMEGDLVPGEEMDLTVDQILIEDATGSMTALQFEALEAEPVAALDRARALLQPDRKVQEFSGSESLPEAPPGVRGQRRGYEEASPLEVEDRVHAQDLLATTRRVVYAPADHSSDDIRTALCTGRRRT